ncbi:MAG: hypothetical protein ACYTHJ_00335 [Planctomycetota bacterium]|jgi:hypothetical protein
MTKMLIGFVGTVFALDLALARIEAPEIYGSTNRALWKWRLIENHPDVPEVVVLGCSYEVHGINPSVVDDTVASDSAATIETLNLASSASSLLTEYLMVRRLLESDKRPSIAYLGITPNAVDAWLHSWMTNGLRALGDVRDLPFALRGGSHLMAEAVPASLFQSYSLWHDTRLVTERVLLAAPIMPASDIRRYDNGWAEWTGGHVATPVADSDDTIRQDAMRLRMSPDNINGIAIRRAITMLRARGVAVKMIELPLSSHAPAYADPKRNEYYHRFVARLVADTGVEILRPPPGLIADDDFWDDVHLTSNGARKVSQWLARDVINVLHGSRHAAAGLARSHVLPPEASRHRGQDPGSGDDAIE